jgi:hypothetical protein
MERPAQLQPRQQKAYEKLEIQFLVRKRNPFPQYFFLQTLVLILILEREMASKVKCKIVPVPNYTPRREGVRGRGCKEPRFLDLGISWT